MLGSFDSLQTEGSQTRWDKTAVIQCQFKSHYAMDILKKKNSQKAYAVYEF